MLSPTHRTRADPLSSFLIQHLPKALQRKNNPIDEPVHSFLVLFLREAVFTIERSVSGAAHKPTVWQRLSHTLHPLLRTANIVNFADFSRSDDNVAFSSPLIPFPLDLPASLLNKIITLVALESVSTPNEHDTALRTKVLRAAKREVAGLSWVTAEQLEAVRKVVEEL
jgi:hypothetical protein